MLPVMRKGKIGQVRTQAVCDCYCDMTRHKKAFVLQESSSLLIVVSFCCCMKLYRTDLL